MFKSKLMSKLRQPQSTGTAEMAHNICKFKQKASENVRTKSCQKLIKHNTGTVVPINRVIAKEARIYNHAFLFKDFEPLQVRLGMFSTLISNH